MGGAMARYKFKGYTITNCGYHQPDHCVWWEAVDENGDACFHGHTLREVEFEILDYEWEQKIKAKDEEIVRLKERLFLSSAANRDASEMIFGYGYVGTREGHHVPDANMSKKRIESAHAAPARQCDVGTAEEQLQRWCKFCDTQNACEDCPCNKGCGISADCFARWAQTPYEAEG